MHNKDNAARPAPAAPSSIDWRRVIGAACLSCDWTELARTALGSPELAAMVGEAFRMIGRSIERDIAQVPPEAATASTSAAPEPPRVEMPTSAPPPVVVDEAATKAAETLGVAVTATEDEIRAALRARLSAAPLHPDHGGDGDEAKRLIAAKNLLIERARAARA